MPAHRVPIVTLENVPVGPRRLSTPVRVWLDCLGEGARSWGSLAVGPCVLALPLPEDAGAPTESLESCGGSGAEEGKACEGLKVPVPDLSINMLALGVSLPAHVYFYLVL